MFRKITSSEADSLEYNHKEMTSPEVKFYYGTLLPFRIVFIRKSLVHQLSWKNSFKKFFIIIDIK